MDLIKGIVDSGIENLGYAYFVFVMDASSSVIRVAADFTTVHSYMESLILIWACSFVAVEVTLEESLACASYVTYFASNKEAKMSTSCDD